MRFQLYLVIYLLIFFSLSQARAENLRPFSSDRPSSTNSAYTIDAGHLQLEIEAFNFSNAQVNAPNPNLRVGLTSSTELNLAWLPLFFQSGEAAMGDLNLRVKKNLIGNDSGNFAAALMPGIKIPTHTHGFGNSKLEPTLMIPLSTNLPFDFGLNLMPEYDLRKDSSGDSLHSEFNFPITIGHRLFGNLAEYIEYVIHANFDPQNRSSGTLFTEYLGLGISQKLTKNIQLDLGCNIGLNSATFPFAVFGGWVIRK